LNPDQRVSTTWGATPRELNGSPLQLVITGQQTRSRSFPINWSPRGCRITPYPHGEPHLLRIFWARLRRRIFFLRHFQRCLPLFFQARELLFIRLVSSCVVPGFRRRLKAFCFSVALHPPLRPVNARVHGEAEGHGAPDESDHIIPTSGASPSA
jgi:hypothetical protein